MGKIYGSFMTTDSRVYITYERSMGATLLQAHGTPPGTKQPFDDLGRPYPCWQPTGMNHPQGLLAFLGYSFCYHDRCTSTNISAAA